MYHNIIYKEALKKVESNDEAKIIEGIKSLRESGKPEAVGIVLNILEKNTDEGVHKECIQFFNDIKDQKATSLIVDAIRNVRKDNSLQVLVSSAWQSNLDYSAYLEVFIDIVLTKDYLVAYEAFTVIENHIDKVEKSRADKIEKMVSEGAKKVEKEKQPMVNELLQVIMDLKHN